MRQTHSDRVVKYGLTLCALGLIAASGSLALAGGQGGTGGQNGSYDPDAPNAIHLAGIIRDFRASNVADGHPDFEVEPANGAGHYMGNVALTLDADHKPVFTGEGYKCTSQWQTASGIPIHPRFFDSSKGDQAGSAGAPDPGAISSAQSFSQWYRNVAGLNVATMLVITLERDESGNYVFDDRLDSQFAYQGGFFPINDALMGGNKNHHFTYEIATEFKYQAGQGQMFRFRGDDDVWVFIDDQLVIDIGGVHGVVEQCVLLDRLDWLQDGQTHQLRFFFAERKKPGSNFRMETNFLLRSVDLPNSAALYD